MPTARSPLEIAGGLLGPRTYEGGLATAGLGLVCQFVIAVSAAAVYFAASRRLCVGLPIALVIRRGEQRNRQGNGGNPTAA